MIRKVLKGSLEAIRQDLATIEANLGIPKGNTLRWDEIKTHEDGDSYIYPVGLNGWGAYTQEQSMAGVITPVTQVDFPEVAEDV